MFNSFLNVQVLQYLPHNAFEAILEPFHGLFTLDLVASTNRGLASAASRDTLTRAGPIDRQYI